MSTGEFAEALQMLPFDGGAARGAPSGTRWPAITELSALILINAANARHACRPNLFRNAAPHGLTRCSS